MKRKRNQFIIIIILQISISISSCEKDIIPFTGESQTPYGTITQIDEYPLYKINYTSDYEFEQFLETGTIPFYSSISSKEMNYSCTCFTAFGGEERLFGRNYDWSNRASYFIVFTNPQCIFICLDSRFVLF
jgi:hypothetical protein